MEIPSRGWYARDVLAALEERRRKNLDVHSGRVFGYAFHPPEEIEKTALEAFARFLPDNALDPTSFPGLVQVEREVVRMVANLLRGDEDVVGNFTSGGTESILLAVKSARDKARSERPDLREPEIVLPKSAHCAFHKAAHYFDLRPVVVGLDRKTFQADVDEMRGAISPRTVMMVASAPQYAQGVIDPIGELAALAHERGIWLHVDACVGGIQLSIMRGMAEFEVPPFDFSLPGVTSMSADMHKYGYSPKGASVVLYRNKSFRRHQIFSSIDSATYALINSNIQSTRSGGPMAGAWAVLHLLGKEGYEEMCRTVMAATGRMIDLFQATDELYVLGEPAMSMFSVASDRFNVFELADEMSERGWYLQPQFSTDWTPMNLHVSVSFGNVAVVEAFGDALAESLRVLRQRPPLSVEAVRGQVLEAVGNASSEEDAKRRLGAMAGFQSGELPSRFAMINTVLETLPREMGARVLGEFVNDLYV